MKCVSILICLHLLLPLQGNINKIPQHEVKKIKHLFEDLVDDHDFSYTIFGSKPMSLADYCLEPPSAHSPLHWIKSRFHLFTKKINLNAWYKSREEFTFKDFILLDEEKDLFDCLVLVLINKKNMLPILQEHESIFKEELGSSFTPESFLEKLEQRESSFANAIHKNQKLLGIMLGYGVHNATLFQEKCELYQEIEKTNNEALVQRLHAIESQVECFSELEADAIIHPLYFMADTSHPETIALKQQYEEERSHLIELRKQNNFMDLVLKRLATKE